MKRSCIEYELPFLWVLATIFAIALIVLGGCANTPYEHELEYTATVMVVANYGDEQSVGTGTHLNGKIVTAYHVVMNAKSVRVIYRDGTNSGANLIDHDADLDIAILRPTFILAGVRSPQLYKKGLDPKDRVYAVSHMLGMSWLYIEGYCMGTQTDVFLVNMQVGAGASGSAVYNEENRIVGFLTGMMSADLPTDHEHPTVHSTLAFGTPIKSVCKRFKVCKPFKEEKP